jgi:hypothetical protein
LEAFSCRKKVDQRCASARVDFSLAYTRRADIIPTDA